MSALGYFALLVLATHWPRLPTDAGFSHDLVQLDKIAHVLALALLTALMTAAKPVGRRAPERFTLLLATGFALAVAWTIEQTQPLVGRTSSAADLLAGAGGAIGMYLVLGARAMPRAWRWPMWGLRLLGLLALPPLVAVTFLPWGAWIMKDWGPLVGLSPARDQAAHFYLAMAVCWLLALVCPAGRTRPRLGAALVILAMGVSGPVIEFAQGYTGRGQPSMPDLWAHMQGVVLAMVGWAVMATLRSPITWTGRGLSSVAGLVLGRRAGRSDEGHTGHALAGHASLISGLTLVSRLTGLVRDATLAAIFGVSTIADAFFIGFLVPNLFRRLFGEGALSAAFIPRYSELSEKDPALARRFAGMTLAGLAGGLGALTLIGEGVLWLLWQAGGGSTGSPGGGLAIELTMWMLPYMPLVCLVALMGGILQVHRRFGPPATAPVALNLFIIAAALMTGWQAAGDAAALHFVARAAAGAVLTAGVVQLLWQWLAVRASTQVAFRSQGVGPPMRRLVKAMAPLMLGLAVFQINAFLDSLIALTLSAEAPDARLTLAGLNLPYPMQTGAVASLQWAQRLYQFPLGVFGIAIATAIFPALSEAAAQRRSGPVSTDHTDRSQSEDDKNTGATAQGGDAMAKSSNTPSQFDDRLATILHQGLRLTLFIGLPASAGLLLVRLPLVRTIYERGAFVLDDAQRVATILSGYAAAVWAYSLSHVLTRCFYAVGDEQAPVRVGMAMVGLNLVLNLLLIWMPLGQNGEPLGAAGLAWSTAVCAGIQALWLLRRVQRHVNHPVNPAVRRSWGRTCLLTAAMSVVVGAAAMQFEVAAMGWWANAAVLALLVSLGAGVVLLGAWVADAEELKWLLGHSRQR